MELALTSGNTSLSPTKGLLGIVDTEAKQLRAIEDLYAIMVAQPKYQKLGGKQWNPTVEPLAVLQWILRKLGALADGEDWTIDTYQEGRKTRYCMVISRGYSANYSYNLLPVKGLMEHIPLEFLPDLLKRDKPMHDLIVDTVALVAKHNEVPLWDSDGEYAESVNQVLTDPYYQNDFYHHRVATYRDGAAAAYLKLLNSRLRVKPEDIKEQVRLYKTTSQRKERMVWWVRRGLEVAAYKQTIAGNTYIPAYEPRKNIRTPYHLYKFIWSTWERDPVAELARERLDALKQAYYSTVSYTVTKPGQVMQPFKMDRFPTVLDHFMNTGRALFSSTHHDYFFGPLVKMRKTLSAPTLLEILT